MSPLGHWLLTPPQQRGMPEVSSRQRAPDELTGGELPVQHATGELIDKMPPSGSIALPHTVPGDEHELPLLQRWVPGSHTTVPFGLGAPPQHCEVERQKLPVKRQPVAGEQTV